MHRYLSFQRAGIRPTTERYNIVARHPGLSLFIGISSLLISGIIGLPFIEHMWRSLLWAIPLTFFYLTPPVKGWRRLRDLPYVKVLFVALAWMVMTHELSVRVVGQLINEESAKINQGLISIISPGGLQQPYSYEIIVRFLFTLSIAILFDFRDTVLDRSQQVKTIAGNHPRSARTLVAASALINIYIISQMRGYPILFAALAGAIYAATIIVASLTHEKRSEAWFAVIVNGLLWGPVVAGIITALVEGSFRA